MDVSSMLVGIIVFIYFYYWYRRPKRSPPGPRGIPVLGVLPFLGKYQERKMYEWSKTYGPVMSVRIATADNVVLSNYDHIMQALVKQSIEFSGRPNIPIVEPITKGHGILFVDNGEKLKSQRKFGLLTLREFGFGKKSLEGRIIEELDCLSDTIRFKNGKPFEIQVLLKSATSNVICNLVMGRRFEYDDPQFKAILERMVDSFSDPASNLMRSILFMVPWLKYIPPFTKFTRTLEMGAKSLLSLLGDIIKEHEASFDSNELRDFIDAFVKEKNKNEDPHFSNIQLIQYVRDLFFAGTETTSTTLSWALLCFLHYPQTQIKLREEIMNVIGSNGTISTSKKSEMPYTNAFIQELLRFRTLVPLSVFHKTNQDTELDGYFIAKDTTIFPNLWAVHNDPNLWDEPEKFKPERFLDEKGNFLPSNHVIPFSVGPRHCLGEQLARMELFIFLVGMIQKFEFLPDPSADQLPDIEKGSNGPIFVPLSYNIVAKELQ